MRPNNSFKPSPLRGLGRASYDHCSAVAAALPGLTQALDAMKVSLALFLALLAAPTLADTPLPPPEKRTTCSPSGKVCVTSDPAKNSTVLSSKTSREGRWTIPGWHRWIFVSEDGKSVVIGHDGMSLVPLNVTLKEPVLFFYNRGKLVRTVTLGDLYKRKSQLIPTASHLAWVYNLSINDNNQLVVKLVNGKTLVFAADTGQAQLLSSSGI